MQDNLKAAQVISVALVVGEAALIEIPEQVERLDADVGATKAALEQSPEVLQTVGVDPTIDVPLGMIDGTMVVAASKGTPAQTDGRLGPRRKRGPRSF